MKIIRLTEQDIVNVVKKIISEQEIGDEGLNDEDKQLFAQLDAMGEADKYFYKDEIEKLKQKTREIRMLEKKYENELKANAFIDFLKKDEEMRKNPTIYLSKIKKPNSEIYYIIGKTLWNVSPNVKKNLAVYVGKLSDFNNDTHHPEAKRIAVEKMKKKIEKDVPKPIPEPDVLRFIVANLKK